MKFKTNAKCGGCSASIIKALEKIAPSEMWEIDLASPDKVLTCKDESLRGREEEIISIIESAGFKASKID